MAPVPRKLCNASTPWSRASTTPHRMGAAHRHVVSLQMKRAMTATHRRPKQAQDGHMPSMPALHAKTDWIAPPRAIATSALLAQQCRNSSPGTRTTSCISAPKHNMRTPHLPFPIGRTDAATIAGACGRHRQRPGRPGKGVVLARVLGGLRSRSCGSDSGGKTRRINHTICYEGVPNDLKRSISAYVFKFERGGVRWKEK
jgi:hypothetical protein